MTKTYFVEEIVRTKIYVLSAWVHKMCI